MAITMSRVQRMVGVGALAAALMGATAPPVFASSGDTPDTGSVLYTLDGYTVTTTGIHLTDGQTFGDHWHVNVRYTSSTQRTATPSSTGFHIEGKCSNPDRHPECSDGSPMTRAQAADLIGEKFVSWEDLGLDLDGRTCVSWVQVNSYNDHFGEGKTAGKKVCGPFTTTDTPQPTTPTAPPVASDEDPTPDPTDPPADPTDPDDTPVSEPSTDPTDPAPGTTDDAPTPGETTDPSNDPGTPADPTGASPDSSEPGLTPDEGVAGTVQDNPAIVVTDGDGVTVAATDDADDESVAGAVAGPQDPTLAETGASATLIAVIVLSLSLLGAGFAIFRIARRA